MGERRLFSTKITESDAFLDMPLSTQALYFHLCLNADDDGVVDSPKKVVRMINATADDLNLLASKRFVLPLNTSVIVIKHWLVHNSINKQRYKVTKHAELMLGLYMKNDGTYTDDPSFPHWQPVTKQCLNIVSTNVQQLTNEDGTLFNLSQVKSSQDKLSKDKLSQSIIDRLTDDEYKTLSAHVEDWGALLERLESVEADTVKSPYKYTVTVAKQAGVWK